MKTGMTRVLAVVAAWLISSAAVPESRQTAPGRLRAGAAKVEITPKSGDLTIATDSIRDPLFARVIVVDDGRRVRCWSVGSGRRVDGPGHRCGRRGAAATGCPPDNSSSRRLTRTARTRRASVRGRRRRARWPTPSSRPRRQPNPTGARARRLRHDERRSQRQSRSVQQQAGVAAGAEPERAIGQDARRRRVPRRRQRADRACT